MIHADLVATLFTKPRKTLTQAEIVFLASGAITSPNPSDQALMQWAQRHYVACSDCGKPLLAKDAASLDVPTCQRCYDLAGLENEHADGHHTYVVRGCPSCPNIDPDRAAEFIRTIANMTKDGELDSNGDEFMLENDDAWETVHSLISQARAILGQPQDRKRVDDAGHCVCCGIHVHDGEVGADAPDGQPICSRCSEDDHRHPQENKA